MHTGRYNRNKIFINPCKKTKKEDPSKWTSPWSSSRYKRTVHVQCTYIQTMNFSSVIPEYSEYSWNIPHLPKSFFIYCIYSASRGGEEIDIYVHVQYIYVKPHCYIIPYTYGDGNYIWIQDGVIQHTYLPTYLTHLPNQIYLWSKNHVRSYLWFAIHIYIHVHCGVLPPVWCIWIICTIDYAVLC